MLIRILFVEPLYSANIGYIARAMMNFGLKDLFLINPQVDLKCARPYATHAGEILKKMQVVQEISEALRDIDLIVGTTAKKTYSPRKVTRICITPKDFAEKINEFQGHVAILFGREDTGLRNLDINRCDMLIHIPSNTDYHTLNVSHAAAIIFYELYKKRIIESNHILPGELRQILFKKFHDLVENTCIPKHRRKLIERSFRNIIARSWITTREATLLIGMFDRCVDKLSQ